MKSFKTSDIRVDVVQRLLRLDWIAASKTFILTVAANVSGEGWKNFVFTQGLSRKYHERYSSSVVFYSESIRNSAMMWLLEWETSTWIEILREEK